MAARKDARRKAILAAATHLFGEHGYHATTVPMIVAQAEISTGSFYMYFRNKEDVFAAALEALGERSIEVAHGAHDGLTDPLRQIGAAVESLFMFLADNPREARLMIVESSGLSPRLERIRRGVLARHADEVRKTLTGRSGRTSASATIAAQCLVGAVFEPLCAWLEKPESERPPAGKVARAVAAYNVRALSNS
jgi:AcrR family transcriptional regulator